MIAIIGRRSASPPQNRVTEPPSPIEILKSSQLLASLTDENVSDLAFSSRMAHAKRGEIIWTSGSQVDFFGVVGTGFVKMSLTTGQGHDITTEIIGPNQVFGLLGALDGEGCPQMATAVCETDYLKVRKQDMQAVYSGNVVLKERMVGAGTTRVRRLLDRLPQVASGRVDERIASVLVMLGESFGEKDGDAIEISVPLTRQDLAEMAGTTVESTIRVLSTWQKRGILRTVRQHTTLLKPQLLMEVIEGRPLGPAPNCADS